MKIVLVFPPYYLESMYNLPPLGLINLGTALKGYPHEVVILDFVLAIRDKTLAMGRNIYDDCADRIMAEDPDLVGFSTQCTTYPAVLQIAGKLKQADPGLKLVLGGHNASFVDQATLQRFPFVDAVVRGEGEITFPELVAAYQKGTDASGIPGVTWRFEDRVIRNKDRDLITDLDALSLPDYNLVPPPVHYQAACGLPRSIVILEVGRGCPHHCIYCSQSVMWQRRTRTFSPSRLVREMGKLHHQFHAGCFLLAFDQFTARRVFVEEFCRRVIDAGLNEVPWYCISRLDSVDGEILSLMHRAGCESMCYGIDSGSKRTLSYIRKNMDHRILYDRVLETAEHHIVPTLSFVIGFPQEGKEDIDETLTMALRSGIAGDTNPIVQLPTVLPGTDLLRENRDALVRRVDTYFSLGLEFDEGKRLSSDERLINSDPGLFSSFYNVPCRGLSLESLYVIAGYFPLMVRLYPKSFLLLCAELQTSVSDCFLDWLRWVTARAGRSGPGFTPQEGYRHFETYVKELLSGKAQVRRGFFTDMLRYETLCLEAGKFRVEENPFHIDLNRIGSYRPVKNPNILVEEFDHNLPEIVNDLKRGCLKEDYPREPTVLVLMQGRNLLDVSEINAFTRDFLELSDGKRPVVAICDALYGTYGKDLKKTDFFDACAEAVQVLAEKNLISDAEMSSPRFEGKP